MLPFRGLFGFPQPRFGAGDAYAGPSRVGTSGRDEVAVLTGTIEELLTQFPEETAEDSVSVVTRLSRTRDQPHHGLCRRIVYRISERFKELLE
jgi:hypothetical protein